MSDLNLCPDVSTLFASAKESGELSPNSANILNGLSQRINQTMVAPAVTPTITDITLVCMLIDNTPSMENGNNHLAAIEGHNLVVNALANSRAVNSVESLTQLIIPNSAYIKQVTGDSDEFRWTAIKAAPRLEKRSFIRGSNTPLYDRTLMALGSVLARTKWWEDLFGVQCRTVTLIMTDGGNNDGKATAAQVAQLVQDMLAQEKHRIYFMGLACAGLDFKEIALEMGIPAQFTDVVERDPKSIRAKFQLFSQSAASVVLGQGQPPVLF